MKNTFCMRNNEKMTLELKRSEVCNLLRGCLNSYILTAEGEDEETFLALYYKISNQLKEFDNLLNVEQPLPFN